MATRVRLDASGVAHFHALVEEKRGILVDEIADDARAAAPVDTGALRNSVQADRATGTVSVGTDHWEYVEYGTRYMRAEPYMRPALYKPRTVR